MKTSENSRRDNTGSSFEDGRSVNLNSQAGREREERLDYGELNAGDRRGGRDRGSRDLT
jgi:hypothetical protein